MKALFDKVSKECSALVTKTYSTSFSQGVHFLDRKFHNPIHGIYGFVRLADEIVDSFHEHDKEFLMSKFREDTVSAIEHKISLNPILHSFQLAVHQYQIDWELIDTFLQSMETDLHQSEHDRGSYDQYIVGSAEVVGLMCLRVFTENDNALYLSLKPYAMKLGAAFQKVNFLRDLKADYQELGRTYFPNVNFDQFSNEDKQKIQTEILHDFQEALIGIKALPLSSRRGVYLAYYYYLKLFEKIKETPAAEVMNARIRIPDIYKVGLLCKSIIKLKLNQL